MTSGRETWRQVAGWAGYAVSDRGRVRSARGLLAQHADGNGYLTVTLSDGKRRRTARVHVLVAVTFLGPRPFPGAQVRHLRRQWDNRAAVLAWGTQAENEADKASGGNKNLLGRKQGLKTERNASRGGNACHRYPPSPGQMPVTAQLATGAETTPAITGNWR